MRFPLLLCVLAFAGMSNAAEMPMLNDHLRVTLPDEAVYSPQTKSRMHGRQGAEETQVWVGEEGQRMFVDAREMGFLAGPEYPANMQKVCRMLLAKDADAFDISVTEKGIVALRREVPQKLSGQNSYGMFLHRHADDSVQLCCVYFGADAAKDAESCRRRCQEVFESLKPGEGSFGTDARWETMDSMMQGGRLQIPVPKGYRGAPNNKARSPYITYIRMENYGEALNEFTVQVGDLPELFYENAVGLPEWEVDGTLLGQEVVWHLMDTPNNIYVAECLLPLGVKGQQPTFPEDADEAEEELVYLHLSVFAASEELREELRRRAEHIRLSEQTPETVLP